LLYETLLESLSAIIEEAVSMDADAGIRVEGKFNGKRCYAFVTRFGRRYAVMIYERRAGRVDGLGRRLAAEELGGPEALGSLLRKLLPRRVRAYVY